MHVYIGTTKSLERKYFLKHRQFKHPIKTKAIVFQNSISSYTSDEILIMSKKKNATPS